MAPTQVGKLAALGHGAVANQQRGRGPQLGAGERALRHVEERPVEDRHPRSSTGSLARSPMVSASGSEPRTRPAADSRSKVSTNAAAMPTAMVAGSLPVSSARP